MANKNSETQENPTQLERQLNRIRYTKALGRLVGVDLREEEGRIRKNFGNLQIETSPGVMD